MMVSEGLELIDFLFKAFAVVLISGLIVLPFVSLKIKPVMAILTVSLVSVITSLIAVKSFNAPEVELIINGGIFFGDIPFRIDALSGWFILIINFTSITGVFYGAGYLKTKVVRSHLLTSHWILYLLFHSSMLLVSMVQHSVAFLVAWEIMSVSSFLLVMFDNSNRKVIKAGVNYLVQMHISVIFLTIAFIWVHFRTGTFDFRGIDAFFRSNSNIWLFLIFFAGFGIKAGFIGLHTWLPLAHPAAPSHISGVMSGVIVKLGIYGILRIVFYLKSDLLLLGEIVISVSLLTGLFGIMNAAVHRDFKKLLAYCTIENIGIIGIGIGIGLIGLDNDNILMIFLGFSGALLHVLNHSLFKSLLFFSAGSVYCQMHTRDMDKLGGLIKVMPKTSLMFLTGAVAIGGIPPLNGFISEFLIYCGIASGINSHGVALGILMIVAFAGMSLIGGISILTFSKAFGTIFLGFPRQKMDYGQHEVSGIMLIPQYLIAFVMILIGIFPGIFISTAGSVLGQHSMINMINPDIQRYISVLRSISLASVIFLVLTLLIFLLRYLVARRSEEKSPVWGCGYSIPNARMQYTGKSFSKSFGKLLGFILIEKKSFREIEINEIFPDRRKYSSYYLDFFETRIIDPGLQIITKFINFFQFIQNGKIQAYVLYGILFIIVIFIGTILNL